MKPLLLAISILVSMIVFAQQQVEVKSIEYVWERQANDSKIVFAKDALYSKMLENSLTRAIANKWNTLAQPLDVKVIRLPSLRSQPKFNTTVTATDTSKRFLFIQLFDNSIPDNTYNPSLTARIEVRYRLVGANATVEDKTVPFKVFFRNPPPGQIRIKRYPFYPSQFQLLCDTIAAAVFNDDGERSEKEVWLSAACGYTAPITDQQFSSHIFRLAGNRQSIEVLGENAFAIKLDSTVVQQTGKKRHRATNTAGNLFTLLSNVDTDKKRSALFTADQTFSEGSTSYHAYINYAETKIAERHRVNNGDGYKSIEVDDYAAATKVISPNEKHFITLNGDTALVFTINFLKREDHFTKLWDGKDSTTVDSLPAAFNNLPAYEMEMKGQMEGSPFVLTTSGEAQIRKLTLKGEDVFTFLANSEGDGILAYHNLSARQVKMATLLCMLSEQYFQYK